MKQLSRRAKEHQEIVVMNLVSINNQNESCKMFVMAWPTRDIEKRTGNVSFAASKYKGRVCHRNDCRI